MKKITFVTGNESKFLEVQRYLKSINSDIELFMEDLDVPEAQSLNVEKIAQEKAAYAWNILKKPIIIDDGGVFIEQYNKFPGALSKYIYKGIGLRGVWELAKNDPRAYFMCCIVYQDESITSHTFTGMCYGKIIEPVGSIRNPDFPFTDIFVPNGLEKSLAQLFEEKDESLLSSINHRCIAAHKLHEFLMTYNNNEVLCKRCNSLSV